MGMSKGTQPLPFGHSSEAAVDIEGLLVSLMLPPLVHRLTSVPAPGGPSQKTS